MGKVKVPKVGASVSETDRLVEKVTSKTLKSKTTAQSTDKVVKNLLTKY